MRKVFTIDINDEPLVETSTGKRQATITYTGGRYVYTEVCTLINKTYALVHMSDTNTEEDNQIAQDRLTLEEGRVIMVIDANENPITACIITDQYTMSVEDYTEELPNGQTYVYEYGEDPGLRDIFDITNATFDPETKNYTFGYIYNELTFEEYVKSIQDLIDVIDQSFEDNDYTESDTAVLNEYKKTLEEFKAAYDGSIASHKLAIPLNPLLNPVN